MTDFYVFDNSEVGSLVYSLNQLGPDLVGAEVGAYRAQCSCCLLQKCDNIKKIYLVDSYKPHFDKIQNLYFDKKENSFSKILLQLNAIKIVIEHPNKIKSFDTLMEFSSF
jgi:hypothetical protein